MKPPNHRQKRAIAGTTNRRRSLTSRWNSWERSRPSQSWVGVSDNLAVGATRVGGPLLARDLQAPRAADLDHVAVGQDRDAQADVAARGAAQDGARPCIVTVRAERVALAARLAHARHGGHVGPEHLDEQPREAVAVEPEGLLGHRPVGPKRSVRIAAGGWPSDTRLSAACSTNAVGPQTKIFGSAEGVGPTSSSISASTRRS